MRHVGNVDRRLLVDDAARMLSGSPGMALDHVDALDDQPVLGRHRLQDLALLASIAAADHDHPITLFDLQLLCHHGVSSIHCSNVGDFRVLRAPRAPAR
jgi:hypothetical protein